MEQCWGSGSGPEIEPDRHLKQYKNYKAKRARVRIERDVLAQDLAGVVWEYIHTT